MPIGSLGDIVFSVSDEEIRTFSGMVYKVGARYSVHQRINGRPLAEYTGTEQETLSLNIKLSAFLGNYPRKEMYRINDAVRDGVPLRLVLGKTQFGQYKWVIKSASSKLERIDNRGRILSISMQLNLAEYAKR